LGQFPLNSPSDLRGCPSLGGAPLFTFCCCRREIADRLQYSVDEQIVHGVNIEVDGHLDRASLARSPVDEGEASGHFACAFAPHRSRLPREEVWMVGRDHGHRIVQVSALTLIVRLGQEFTGDGKRLRSMSSEP